MKNFLLLTFLLTVISFNYLSAQKSKQEITGDALFLTKNYDKAIKQYTKSPKLTLDGNRKLALSYNSTGKYKEALPVFAKFVNDSLANSNDYYNYAIALRGSGNYNDALVWMDKFRESNPEDSRLLEFVKSKDLLDKLLIDEARFKIKNLDVNTKYQEYGAAFYKRGKTAYLPAKKVTSSSAFSFTSNVKTKSNLLLADVKSSQLLNPVKVDKKKFSSKNQIANVAFAKKGSYIAFTKKVYHGKGKDAKATSQLFFSRTSQGKWQTEKPFKLNSKEYSVGQPWMNESGDTMYFVSNMSGGFGGTDIYKVVKDDLGEWGDAMNMGSKINTAGDEMYPFYHDSTKVLYFSSNGHGGLGGLDVYVAPIRQGNVGKVINLGTPVNTQYDDFGLIQDDNLRGFFTSNRPTGKGSDDIYSFNQLIPFKFEKTIFGKTIDNKGNQVFSVNINLSDNEGNSVSSTISDDNAVYSFTVEPDKSFTLLATKQKYFDAKNTISSTSEYDTLKLDILIEKDPDLKLYSLLTEKTTKAPIDAAKVVILDKKSGASQVFNSTSNGDFMIKLPNNKLNDVIDFSIKIEKEGYFVKNLEYKRVLDKEGQYNIHDEADLSIVKFEVGMDLGKTLGIYPIFYDYNKSDIKPEAEIELNKIVKVMNENPGMVVELGAHTDCKGTVTINKKLSDARAKAASSYIKGKISNPERILEKGFGEDVMMNKCSCLPAAKDACTELDHEKNRRTEFVILKL
jgi:outer membrane protein OmpA-like peptidoglycan-associated protein